MILFAEDSADDAFLLKRAFRKVDASRTIEHFEDGDHVITFLSTLRRDRTATFKQPRLLLLDLKMPASNGFDVLRWRQENSFWFRLPVVVFSSSSEERDLLKAYELGANSYAVKPSTLDGYRKFAEGLSIWWLDHNRTPGSDPKRPFSPGRGY